MKLEIKLNNIIKQTLIDLDQWELSNTINFEQEAIVEYISGELLEIKTLCYDPVYLKERLEESFNDFQLTKDNEEEPVIDLFCRKISTRLHDNKIFGDEIIEADEEDEFQKYSCELCKRICPLTFHHLIPKETHSQMLKKGLFTKEYMRTHGAKICRICHSAVHRLFSNKKLAMELNTVDKLLETEEIQKWVKFAERQKVRIKFFRANK